MTLVEAMLCIVILGLTASGISNLYVSGLRTLDNCEERLLLDGQLRSAMETLVADSFSALLLAGSGTRQVTVDSVEHTASWSATRIDLDGDGLVEPSALLLTVSLEGRSLSIVMVDPQDPLAKIP